MQNLGKDKNPGILQKIEISGNSDSKVLIIIATNQKEVLLFISFLIYNAIGLVFVKSKHSPHDYHKVKQCTYPQQKKRFSG